MADELPDTPENRRAAARRYLATAPVMADLLGPIAAGVAPRLSSEQRARILAAVREDVIEAACIPAFARHLTVRELDAMTRFFSSAEWLSIKRKLPEIMTAIAPVLHEEIKRALESVRGPE